MRAAVRAAFVPFSAPLEGVVAHMYLDVRGLVTTAIGILIDPLSLALGLPWRRPDGSLANRSEVTAEWERVKARQDLRLRGGAIFKSVTALRLDEHGIADTVATKLNAHDAYLRQRFPAFDDWPADAQLATHSMAWALGPAFRTHPKLVAALQAQDWARAAEECTISTVGNPGVKPRNERNRVLYRNARHAAKLDPDVLYWPRDLESSPVDREAETVPALPDDDDSGPVVDFAVVRPKVHLGRPALDGDEPDGAA